MRAAGAHQLLRQLFADAAELRGEQASEQASEQAPRPRRLQRASVLAPEIHGRVEWMESGEDPPPGQQDIHRRQTG